MGWDGPAKVERLVRPEEVIEHATSLLGSDMKENDPTIVRLAAAGEDEAEVIDSSLRTLSAKELSSDDFEVRKWRYVLLEQVLETLPVDPVAGLIALTEFWEQFDFPVDCPHVVQGRGNDLTAQQYFTAPFLDQMARKHANWLERERRLLMKQ